MGMRRSPLPVGHLGTPLIALALALTLATACSEPDGTVGDEIGAPTEAGATPSSPDVQPSEKNVEPSPSVSPEEEAAGDEQRTVRAKVIDTDFAPQELTVKVGTLVKWTQTGDQPHSVTAVDDTFDSSPECGPIESDSCLSEGSEFEFTFDESGTYDYYCRVHGLPDGTGMFGSVTVK